MYSSLYLVWVLLSFLICSFVSFIKFGPFSATISLNTISALCSFWNSNDTNIGSFVITPQVLAYIQGLWVHGPFNLQRLCGAILCSSQPEKPLCPTGLRFPSLSAFCGRGLLSCHLAVSEGGESYACCSKDVSHAELLVLTGSLFLLLPGHSGISQQGRGDFRPRRKG